MEGPASHLSASLQDFVQDDRVGEADDEEEGAADGGAYFAVSSVAESAHPNAHLRYRRHFRRRLYAGRRQLRWRWRRSMHIGLVDLEL